MVVRITALLFFSLLLFLSACNQNKDKAEETSNQRDGQKEVIVYGSRTCPHCLQFMRELDKNDINYTFLEVDNNDENFKEMYGKIKSINFQGYVNYPVIDVGGEILVAPDYEEFRQFF